MVAPALLAAATLATAGTPACGQASGEHVVGRFAAAVNAGHVAPPRSARPA